MKQMHSEEPKKKIAKYIGSVKISECLPMTDVHGDTSF